MAIPRGGRYQVDFHGDAFAEDAAEEAVNKHASAEAIKNRIIHPKLDHAELSREFLKQAAHEEHKKKQTTLDERTARLRRIESLSSKKRPGMDSRTLDAGDAYQNASQAAHAHRNATPPASLHPRVKSVVRAIGKLGTDVAAAMKHHASSHHLAHKRESTNGASKLANTPKSMLRGKKGGRYYLSRGGHRVYTGRG